MQTSTSQPLAWLGYGGLLPFAAGAFAVVTQQGVLERLPALAGAAGFTAPAIAPVCV